MNVLDDNMNSHTWLIQEISTSHGAWTCEVCGVGSLQPRAFMYECLPVIELIEL